MPTPRRPIDPARAALVPSAGTLAMIGAGMTLIPGVLVYVVLVLAGVHHNVAGLLGLLFVFLGITAFPFYLRHLGRRLPS